MLERLFASAFAVKPQAALTIITVFCLTMSLPLYANEGGPSAPKNQWVSMYVHPFRGIPQR